MTDKPNANTSLAKKELDKAEKQFEAFDQNIKEMTMDRMNTAPKQDVEPQTKLSQKDLEKSKDIYLKPKRTISCRDKFNEHYREAYNFDKEYVHFIAENKEIIGEKIDIWTRPYGGMPAEEWEVPVNTPVWGPRYLAEQIKRKFYHRLTMQQQNIISSDGLGSYYGQMAVDTTIPRLEARPVTTRKSVFMGANNF
jgi:hypothetical protein